jgi:hypothetical protein
MNQTTLKARRRRASVMRAGISQRFNAKGEDHARWRWNRSAGNGTEKRRRSRTGPGPANGRTNGPGAARPAGARWPGARRWWWRPTWLASHVPRHGPDRLAACRGRRRGGRLHHSIPRRARPGGVADAAGAGRGRGCHAGSASPTTGRNDGVCVMRSRTPPARTAGGVLFRCAACVCPGPDSRVVPQAVAPTFLPCRPSETGEPFRRAGRCRSAGRSTRRGHR